MQAPQCSLTAMRACAGYAHMVGLLVSWIQLLDDNAAPGQHAASTSEFQLVAVSCMLCSCAAVIARHVTKSAGQHCSMRCCNLRVTGTAFRSGAGGCEAAV